MAPTVEPRGRLAVGLFLMALGAFLALGQAGLLHITGLGRYWPLLLIGMGWVKVRQPAEDGQRALGATLLLAGGLFLVVGVVSWRSAWPLVFVLLGLHLLWQAAAGPSSLEAVQADAPYLSELAFIGGIKKRPRLSGFRGGYVTAVLGGVELDLRKARMGPGPVVLDVVAVLGGIELKVPAGWNVSGEVTPLLGGFEDKSQLLVESAEAPRLVVRGYAILGGVEVGN